MCVYMYMYMYVYMCMYMCMCMCMAQRPAHVWAGSAQGNGMSVLMWVRVWQGRQAPPAQGAQEGQGMSAHWEKGRP